MSAAELKFQTAIEQVKAVHLQKEIDDLRLQLAKEVRRMVEQAQKTTARRGYSIREIAAIDGLSQGTVRARVQEMQKSKEYQKYVRDYGSYQNGAYRQLLRIDIEGWKAYGQRQR